MFNTISWQGYWLFLAVTLVFYYAIVLFYYYKQQLVSVLLNRRQASPPDVFIKQGADPTVSALSGNTALESSWEGEQPQVVPALTALLDEVQAYFDAAVLALPTKEQLLQQLTFIAQKYPDIQGSTHQYAVTNLILFLAEQSGVAHLSAEEVSAVWLR